MPILATDLLDRPVDAAVGQPREADLVVQVVWLQKSLSQSL
jgi:hypothetical protein